MNWELIIFGFLWGLGLGSMIGCYLGYIICLKDVSRKPKKEKIK